MSQPKLSVIIPALNEALNLDRLLPKISHENIQIIVADGGSEDGTPALVQDSDALLVVSPTGRGRQCNAGSLFATAPYLLFLHADSDINAAELLQALAWMKMRKKQIATFTLKFEPNSLLLSIYSRISRLESFFTTFGDQGVFIARSLFDRLCGFPDWPLLEDVHLFNRARKLAPIARIPIELCTSSRRFAQNGLVRQQLFNLNLLKKFRKGVSVEELAEKYRSFRGNKRDRALIVFAKMPMSGAVKTRLGKVIGLEQAAEIYRYFLDDLFEKLNVKANFATFVFQPDLTYALDFRRWLPPNFNLLVQHGSDLGARMLNAIKRMLGAGFKRVCIIGSDVPELNRVLIEEAFDKLETHDVVLGPSEDGGYYLIGMKQAHASLFENMTWSVENVFKETKKRASQQQLSFHVLPCVDDVDTISDLQAWLETTPNISLASKIGRVLQSVSLSTDKDH